jgi:hypothetical protein
MIWSVCPGPRPPKDWVIPSLISLDEIQWIGILGRGLSYPCTLPAEAQFAGQSCISFVPLPDDDYQATQRSFGQRRVVGTHRQECNVAAVTRSDPS